MADRRERGEIFPGAGEIIDRWLGLDDSWRGTPPRYHHEGNYQKLCGGQWQQRDGLQLVEELYRKLSTAWHQMMATTPRSPGGSNWRFEKRTEIDPEHPGPEVTLERAISRITDPNWVNQCPTLSGLLDSGGRTCNIDLIRRTGTEYTFFELKFADGTPLYAAMEVLQYGIVYLFSRIYATPIGYDPARLEIHRATHISLRVLAPSGYYPEEYRGWLRELEKTISCGLAHFIDKKHDASVTMDFAFEHFPAGFDWCPEYIRQDERLKDLLWALHQRQSLFPKPHLA